MTMLVDSHLRLVSFFRAYGLRGCALASFLVSPGQAQPSRPLESTKVQIETGNLQGQTPGIKFQKSHINIGDGYQGQRLQGQYSFTNTGDGVLQIQGIHAACGCVNTRIEPKLVFAPGEEGTVVFDFETTYFSGRVSKTITLDTNVPSASRVTLGFRAHVKPEIMAKPALLAVGNVAKSFTGNFTIPLEVAGSKAQPVQVLSVESSAPFFTASLDTKGKKPVVLVSFLGGLPPGPLRERIVVTNTSSFQEKLIIPLVGDVVGNVEPSSKYLEFGVVKPGKPSRRQLAFSTRRKDFTLESVHVTLRKTGLLKTVKPEDLIQFEIERQKDGASSVWFEMKHPGELFPAGASINASGMFVVRTSDEIYKEFSVPFFGVLRKDEE